MQVIILGAGVAGLTCALELANRGVAVEVRERAHALGAHSCSWFAGGMLAPWCELEHAEPIVARLGEVSLRWWRQHLPQVNNQGSLVVAHGRDSAELQRLARRTGNFQWLDAKAIAGLEPQLQGRFDSGLWFEQEAHLDPRQTLQTLLEQLRSAQVEVRFDCDAPLPEDAVVVDCTGLAARSSLPELRGVKGEMVLLRAPDIHLQRPIRLLHQRLPVYVVPRDDHVFMVGATMIESDDQRRVSVRSLLELLSAVYALHPAFAEAEVLETGTQVRPAYPDNLPRITRQAGRWFINGLFRHGFLLAPALAMHMARVLLEGADHEDIA